MAYDSPSVRVAFFRGIRLGTELISIIPGMSRLGGEDGTDLDRDTAYVSILSPNMKFQWQVVAYIRGSTVAGATPQLELQFAFLQEMRNFLAAGLKMNDLVWIDEVTAYTKVDMIGVDVTGPQTNYDITVDDVNALGIVPGDYVWVGSESENQGFFAKVLLVGAGPPHTLRIDSIPGPVLDGGVTEEEARKLKDNYDVYKVRIGYRRCKYMGQTLPEVREGSQDDHRFSMSYEFVSDTAPMFKGST